MVWNSIGLVHIGWYSVGVEMDTPGDFTQGIDMWLQIPIPVIYLAGVKIRLDAATRMGLNNTF